MTIWHALWLGCWAVVITALAVTPKGLRRLARGDEERFQHLLRWTVLAGIAAALAAVPLYIVIAVNS